MVIDLHFHALPGIDDGPESIRAATDLVRAAEEAGTTTLVATPHVSWRWPENDALAIADGVLLLNRELRAQGIDVTVRRGAEVALTRAAELADDELRRLRLGGGPWLLVECPREGGATVLEPMLHRLVEHGHRLLLAHPERIPAFREHPELLQRLAAAGIRCQVTAGAFAGRHGGSAQAFAAWMLEHGLVDVVASDAHSLVRRPPSVVAELEEAGLPASLIARLTEESPAAMLAGEDPAPSPRLARPRRAGLGRRSLIRA